MQTVHIIAGPTASGKSAHALALAEKRNGVIINADSLQIYDALPILTARPAADDLARAPHRLYGLLEPAQACSAIIWRDFALTEIHAALHNGQTPIVVGGTGFYLKALMEGLSPIPEIPDEIRLLGEELMDKIGIEAFFKAFRESDPETCEKLDPHNRQRIIRAWEVFSHTGKGLAYWHTLPKIAPDPDLEFAVELLMPLRGDLYETCDARFLKMIEMGALEEARAFDDQLMSGKVPIDAPVTHALGFQYLQQHVRGEMPLETAVMLAQAETRHYAKRQCTWFKHQMKA